MLDGRQSLKGACKIVSRCTSESSLDAHKRVLVTLTLCFVDLFFTCCGTKHVIQHGLDVAVIVVIFENVNSCFGHLYRSFNGLFNELS